MERRIYGDDTDGAEDDLLFVLGWGNRHDHETVQWLIDRLVAAGYAVHAVQIPVNPSDFRAAYVDPLREVLADLGEYRLLGHSTGGLIGEYLDDPTPVTRTYLSPWWAFHPDQRGLALDLVVTLPVGARVIPAGTASREALGELVSDRQLADNPARASPAFLSTIRQAQADVPAPAPDRVVFYTPEDPVIGVDAIERRVPEGNRVQYEGGHELFSSRRRDEYLDTLLAAIESGPDGIR